jgi:ABC-type amino acid transport substrate-binding protein
LAESLLAALGQDHGQCETAGGSLEDGDSRMLCRPSLLLDCRADPFQFLARLAGLCLLLITSNAPSWAAEPADSQSVARVGIVQAPPFAMKDADGNWQGIAVELWRHVARDLGVRFEFQEMPIPDLVAAIERRELVAVVTAVASAEREQVMDLSHPYYSSGLAIAVRATPGGVDWPWLLGNLFSWTLLKIVSAVLALLLLAATLVWLFERRSNPAHFSRLPLQGIGDGLWWAAVTLTTVGYGDKAPTTRWGRGVAVAWMLVAIVLMALFTAQVTSVLTVSRLTGRIRGPADLPHVRVGTLQDSLPQSQLRAKFGVTAAGYRSFTEGLDALDHGDIDAFVGAEPVLRYAIANSYPARLAVVGTPFLRGDYVFALPPSSDIRKAINRSLLAYIDTNEWQELLRQYLGND